MPKYLYMICMYVRYIHVCMCIHIHIPIHLSLSHKYTQTHIHTHSHTFTLSVKLHIYSAFHSWHSHNDMPHWKSSVHTRFYFIENVTSYSAFYQVIVQGLVHWGLGHCPQKSPLISGSFAKIDLQLEKSYGTSPRIG